MGFTGRMIAGSALVYAGLSKIGQAAAFASVLDAHNLLPSALVPLASVLIPWVEIGLGVGCLFGYRLAIHGTVAMYGVMFVVIARGLILRLDIPCGCFGGTEPLSQWTLLRDIMLLAFAVAAEVEFSDHERWLAATRHD